MHLKPWTLWYASSGLFLGLPAMTTLQITRQPSDAAVCASVMLSVAHYSSLLMLTGANATSCCYHGIAALVQVHAFAAIELTGSAVMRRTASAIGMSSVDGVVVAETTERPYDR